MQNLIIGLLWCSLMLTFSGCCDESCNGDEVPPIPAEPCPHDTVKVFPAASSLEAFVIPDKMAFTYNGKDTMIYTSVRLPSTPQIYDECDTLYLAYEQEVIFKTDSIFPAQQELKMVLKPRRVSQVFEDVISVESHGFMHALHIEDLTPGIKTDHITHHDHLEWYYGSTFKDVYVLESNTYQPHGLYSIFYHLDSGIVAFQGGPDLHDFYRRVW